MSENTYVRELVTVSNLKLMGISWKVCREFFRQNFNFLLWQWALPQFLRKLRVSELSNYAAGSFSNILIMKAVKLGLLRYHFHQNIKYFSDFFRRFNFIIKMWLLFSLNIEQECVSNMWRFLSPLQSTVDGRLSPLCIRLITLEKWWQADDTFHKTMSPACCACSACSLLHTGFSIFSLTVPLQYVIICSFLSPCL